MGDVEQIVDEIRQIVTQYKKEVPQRGRAWPASIRERVITLSRLEVSNSEISAKTGIPVPTVYIWTSGKIFNKRSKPSNSGEFVSVDVIPKKLTESQNKSLLAAREIPENLAAKNSKFYSATLPGGVRVDQLNLEALIELSRRLSS